MSSRPSSRSSRRSKRASPATPAKTPGKESAPGSSAKTPKTTKKAKVAAVEAVSAPRFIAQFRALSFCLEGQEDTRRFVYYKEHSVRREDPLSPKGRTMFVLNPPLHSETVVQDLFAKIGGEVLSVRMNHAPIGQSARQVVTANVVYKKAKSVRTAMGRVDSPDSPIVVKAPEVAGVEKWKAAYWSSRPDPAELKESVDAAVKAFDDAVDRQKAEQILLVRLHGSCSHASGSVRRGSRPWPRNAHRPRFPLVHLFFGSCRHKKKQTWDGHSSRRAGVPRRSTTVAQSR